ASRQLPPLITYEERAYTAFAACRRHVHPHHGFHDRDAFGTHADGNLFNYAPTVQPPRSFLYRHGRDFWLPDIVLDRPLRQEEGAPRYLPGLCTGHAGLRVRTYLCGTAHHPLAN